eukprot:g45860.t1
MTENSMAEIKRQLQPSDFETMSTSFIRAHEWHTLTPLPNTIDIQTATPVTNGKRRLNPRTQSVKKSRFHSPFERFAPVRFRKGDAKKAARESKEGKTVNLVDFDALDIQFVPQDDDEFLLDVGPMDLERLHGLSNEDDAKEMAQELAKNLPGLEEKENPSPAHTSAASALPPTRPREAHSALCAAPQLRPSSRSDLFWTALLDRTQIHPTQIHPYLRFSFFLSFYSLRQNPDTPGEHAVNTAAWSPTQVNFHVAQQDPATSQPQNPAKVVATSATANTEERFARDLREVLDKMSVGKGSQRTRRSFGFRWRR